MKFDWAAALPLAERAAAARLRAWDGIEAQMAGDAFWLRGPRLDETMERLLRQLPGALRYSISENGELFPLGSRLPAGFLPAGPWHPLRDEFTLALPDAAYYGLRFTPQCAEQLSLRLVRAASERTPSLLLTSFERFYSYGITAPQVRLDGLSFACDDTGDCLIRGRLLPPLPGAQWVECDGVAVPAGYTWTPAIDVETIRASLGLQAGDIGLFSAAGNWQLVAANAWVQATRSALRLSRRGAAI